MTYLSPAPGAAPPTESAVIVPVADAEPVVREHRDRLDPAAGWGIPAHVTVLYPFVPPSAIDQDLIARVAAAVASVKAFDCYLATTRWFGDEVLWLDPQPAAPFSHLTTVVWDAFPEHPPYGGTYDKIVPHLTVAQRGPTDLAMLRAAEQAVQRQLPVSAHIELALLIAGSATPDSWRILRALPLGGSGTPRP